MNVTLSLYECRLSGGEKRRKHFNFKNMIRIGSRFFKPVFRVYFHSTSEYKFNFLAMKMCRTNKNRLIPECLQTRMHSSRMRTARFSGRL